uniref:Clip-domain serine protease n=1 Tax=Daphnia galeata TaxID=27404 RepID=A0A8J2RI94_9CRUS|nr:unnamed protein product [Daphnia galeata]
MKLRCSILILLAATTAATLAAVTETDGRLQRVTQLIERVKRQSVGQDAVVSTISSSNTTEEMDPQHRDGRGLGSALLQLGKLTLTHLLPLASGHQGASSSSNSGTTSEKISSSNSVEIALPSSTDSPKITSSSSSSSSSRPCTTPDGGRGQCRDLGNCPALLLQLDSLRKSICFQSLFVPGVCCPESKPGNNALVTIINQLAGGGSNNNNNNNNRVTTTTTTKRPTTIDYDSLTSPVTFAPTTTRPFETFLNPIVSSGSQSQGIQPKGRCGQVQVSSFRVVGGELSQPGAWPWMTAIYLNGPKGTEFWCGGTLINERFIMTAAHCTLDGRQKRFRASQYTARFGEYNLRTTDPGESEIFQISEIRIHPQFTGTGFYNDLALFKLERPVSFTDYIQPICLPSNSQRTESFIGQVPTIVGWGTTYYGGRESTVLREVQLPVWRNDDCDRAYLQPITDVFICAGYADGGKDACQGDSGGPLMLQNEGTWTQVGIVSFGNKCAEPGFPGVYTRITHFLDWINANAV